eukprot:snap_masked-scaffold_2-processed-gene-13.23-mRNA-1 protein AED:1.00 eAED:1.00 QI:0/-1/0/0/-1/1/1/0/243
MLKVYSKSGIILYFDNLDLPQEENLVYFAPSLLAQALGSFIRDPSFHQLAFRLDKDTFPYYREYIDTGIIRKQLFDILLKRYSAQEKKYVLKLALSGMIILKYELEKDCYLVPELLPVFKNRPLNVQLKADVKVEFINPLSASIFCKVLLTILRNEQIQEVFLFKGFGRFIFDPERVVDVFQQTEFIIGFQLVRVSYLESKAVRVLNTKDVKLLDGLVDKLYSSMSDYIVKESIEKHRGCVIS